MFTAFSISTAGEDYKVEYTNPITIYPDDNSKKTIFVDAIDDDRVEILKECLTLKIIDVNDPNVYIDGDKNTTKLTIVDDDGKYITCFVYYTSNWELIKEILYF